MPLYNPASGFTPFAVAANTSTTAAGTGTPAIFTNVVRNTGSAYNVSTGVTTVPSAGFYMVTATIYSGANVNASVIYQNGTGVYQGVVNVANTGPAVVTCMLDCAANDTIDVRPTSSVTLTGGSTLNYIMISRVA